nr:aminomethyl-transferring glycine dehydrogenase subunit GcvPA [Gammaproteobacteria bacterium]
MPFIPHTDEELTAMLSAVGVNSLEDLFDEIPPALHAGKLEGIPSALSELELSRLMRDRAQQDGGAMCFVGAGAYDHHIPAAVWELVTRGEFYSAYTPYQAEASQGTLQIGYEFQTMVASLMGLEVSNASLYDGASALAEAVLMAVRLHRRSRCVVMPSTVHPIYRSVARTIAQRQSIEFVELAFDSRGGHIAPESLSSLDGRSYAALVVPQPNFFGILEEVDFLTDWGHANGMLVIGLVNPLAMAWLTPPGQWGRKGADIACGEGQPLGVPLSSGGPYFGFMASKSAHVRQLPGRIVGRTVDLEGKPGFTLTLQAREQHIRRAKATSNICTNQGLLVTAATIYLAILGSEGLSGVARTSHENCVALVQRLTAIAGVERVFERPFFHEAVLRLQAPVAEVLRSLAAYNVLGGYDVGRHFPQLANGLLVCATEQRTMRDIESYSELLTRIMRHRTAARCPVQPKI